MEQIKKTRLWLHSPPPSFFPFFLSVSVSVPSSPPLPPFSFSSVHSLPDDTLLSWHWRAWGLLAHHPRWQNTKTEGEGMPVCHQWPADGYIHRPPHPPTHTLRQKTSSSSEKFTTDETLLSTASLLGDGQGGALEELSQPGTWKEGG